MNDAHICTRGKIWDLHIHSNQCYSITDPKLKKLSVAEYVKKEDASSHYIVVE